MATHNNRYLYVSPNGEPRGPAWLAEMRRLYQGGEIDGDTQVCREGEQEWGPASSFPEITSEEAILPEAPRRPARPPMAGLSWGVWGLILLLALFMFWVQFVYLRE